MSMRKIKQLEIRMAGVAQLKRISSSIPKRGKSTQLIRSHTIRKNFTRNMPRCWKKNENSMNSTKHCGRI